MSHLENLLGAWSLTVADRMTAVGRASGLSTTDQAALVTLLAHPDRPVSWLGDVLDLTSSGATRLVDRLVSSGWVARSAGQDSRQRRVRLTRAGAGLARKLVSGRGAVLAECLEGLDDRDRTELGRLLERLVGGSTPDPMPAMRTCRLCDRTACRSDGHECPLDHTIPGDAAHV
ncbi:MAG: MarR family winged helix-turn-helix transcriptional regulator [Actinomycetota bacterium]|nr:MarR family winged helix-turn-helix transcriptional regulator [Actinomycetota bacterium]